MKPYYRVCCNEACAKEHFATPDGARAKAEMLAGQHQRAFEILKCIGISQTSQANTFWMDGEKPPEEGFTEARYRMLKDGEGIEADDEFQHPDGWRKYKGSYHSIGEQFRKNRHLPHRRPL